MRFPSNGTKVLSKSARLLVSSAMMILFSEMAMAQIVKPASRAISKSVKMASANKKTEPKTYATGELKALLRDVEKRKKKCKASKCDALDSLTKFEQVLASFISFKEKSDVLAEENRFLRNQIKAGRSPANLLETKGCAKQILLNEVLIENGISSNGSALFPKKAISGTPAVCWANSRKKKEATITVCDFPLAINVLTKGGDSLNPVTRSREYLFELNACDLIAVRIVDELPQGKFETTISYSTCLQNWNKRTADAGMTPAQVQLMEDIIGYCFRERLLPPREAKAGKKNPPLVEGVGIPQ
jgi:hypothetical protein